MCEASLRSKGGATELSSRWRKKSSSGERETWYETGVGDSAAVTAAAAATASDKAHTSAKRVVSCISSFDGAQRDGSCGRLTDSLGATDSALPTFQFCFVFSPCPCPSRSKTQVTVNVLKMCECMFYYRSGETEPGRGRRPLALAYSESFKCIATMMMLMTNEAHETMMEASSAASGMLAVET